MKRILGLDPSLNRLGWCIVDYDDEVGKKYLIDYDYIDVKKFDAETEEDLKLQTIYKRMCAVFIKYNPDIVIGESPFFQKNAKTITRLGHCHGILLLVAVEYGKRMKYYSPLTIKSTVLGGIKTKNEEGKKKTGKEMKKEVENAVFNVFSKKEFKKPYTDDVTDAISVALTYILKNGEDTIGSKKPTKPNKKQKKSP